MYFDINGISYYVESCGTGDPLVLLHGFTGYSASWKPYCNSLGKKSKMYMVDLIGHGRTESPEQIERYEITSVASDLEAILDTLGLDKVNLLGYSMGGRVALTFATKYPDRINKLIIESATPGIEGKEERNERRKQDIKLAHLIETKGIQEFVAFWERIPLFETQQNLPEAIRGQIRKQRLQNSVTGLSNSLRGMGTGSQPSLWKHLSSFPFETLLITGELDVKFCRIASEMMKSLKYGKSMTINECGHAIHVEDAEKFGTIVSEFLSNT